MKQPLYMNIHKKLSATLIIALVSMTAAAAELPRLPENVAPASQDFKAQKLLPYLKEAYVSTSPVDLDDGISVGELSMPGAREPKPKKPTGSVRDAHAARGETFIANFENGTDDWEKNGTAFDAGERKNRINGFLGKGYINSYLGGDKAPGPSTEIHLVKNNEQI